MYRLYIECFIVGGKIVYGTAPLKAGDRRPTFEEAVEKKQVRWWGATLMPGMEAKKKILKKAAAKRIDEVAAEAVKPVEERKKPISFTKYARDKTDKEIETVRGSVEGAELMLMHSGFEEDAERQFKGLLREQKLRLHSLIKLRKEQERLWIAAGSSGPVQRGKAAPAKVAPVKAAVKVETPMAERIKIAKDIINMTNHIEMGELMLEVNEPSAKEAKDIKEVIQKSKARLAELKKQQMATGGPVAVPENDN